LPESDLPGPTSAEGRVAFGCSDAPYSKRSHSSATYVNRAPKHTLSYVMYACMFHFRCDTATRCERSPQPMMPCVVFRRWRAEILAPSGPYESRNKPSTLRLSASAEDSVGPARTHHEGQSRSGYSLPAARRRWHRCPRQHAHGGRALYPTLSYGNHLEICVYLLRSRVVLVPIC